MYRCIWGGAEKKIPLWFIFSAFFPYFFAFELVFIFTCVEKPKPPWKLRLQLYLYL